MFLIYVGTLVIWFILLTYLSFSPKSQYVSNKVFSLLIVVSIIPIVNTLHLISALIDAATDKRTKEEKTEAFKKDCEHLDVLLEVIIDKFKNNG